MVFIGWLALLLSCSAVSSTDTDEQLSLLQKRARPLLHDHHTAQASPCDTSNRLIFHGFSVIRNNLGNNGPDAGEEGLVYEDVFPNSGDKVNLIINAAPGYAKAADRNNGVNNKVARINLVTGGKAELVFNFVDANTGSPKTVGPFYMSYLDFDEQQQTGKAREMVTISSFDSYTLTDTTIVNAQENGDGTVKFSSTTWGTGQDNVQDTHSMTQEQLDKSVSVLMPASSSFNLDLEVAELRNKVSNRFFQFAGITNGVCDTSPTTTTTTAQTLAPTPSPTVPTTCGNACSVSMAYKKCAFWGDPHYQKTFNAAPPNYNNFFDLQVTGVVTLAKTKCGSIEIQAVQCPWHGGHAAVAAGFAFRVGSSVATVIENNVRNTAGLSIQGGNPRTITSADSCAQLWIQTQGAGAAGRGYYMNMEIKMDDPADTGNCDGRRQNYVTPQSEILFTSAELSPLCGTCRFTCPGALVERTRDDPNAPPPTAESICEEAGVSYDEADLACQRLSQQTVAGGDSFHHESCIMDFCGSGANQQIIDDEIAVEKKFEEEDR